MSDVADQMQAAWFALLTGNAGVAGAGTPAIGERVYDKVPKDVTFPYIVIGDCQVLGDDDDCTEHSEVFDRIHVWSKAVGFPECNAIAGAIRAAARATPLAPQGFSLILTEFVQQQNLKDPDPLTLHVVLEFRSLIEHTA